VTANINLSVRAAHILGALVGEYIKTAEPVGSSRLARSAGLGVWVA
jgi:transcriptional regulator of heat shock response